MAWAERMGIHIQYIQPGKPRQNAYIERYNRTVRHEWLDQNIFETIEEAQEQAMDWLWTYNNDRPNKAKLIIFWTKPVKDQRQNLGVCGIALSAFGVRSIFRPKGVL